MTMSNKTNAIVHYGVASSRVPKPLTRSLPVILCFLIPTILIIGAYLHMAFFYKKLWLFDTVVHENGKYTLLGTIFYFRHFCWEILGKAVYSMFVVGVFYYYGKPNAALNKDEGVNIPKRRVAISGILLLSLVLLAIIVTANKFGSNEAITGLTQYRASELRPLDFGSHWRNHFLSNIALLSASAFSVLLYRVVCFRGYWKNRRFSILLPVSLLIFVFFTFLFGLTNDPYATPSYLGHQLREIFGSDLSITMFMALGLLIHLENKYDPGELRNNLIEKPDSSSNYLQLLGWLMPVLLIAAFLIVKVLSLDISRNIAKLPGTKDWSVFDLFAWHFFEHSLDYAFVACFVYLLYVLTLRLELKKVAN